MTGGSEMNAISLRRPPQEVQRKTPIENTRRISSDQL